MYKVTWHDNFTDEQKSIKVQTVRAARIVTNSLQEKSFRYRDVSMTRIAPRRFNEVVIIFER